MQAPAPPSPRLRVGEFEVDLRCGELRRNGDKVKLQERPFQILAGLIERPGEVVTREEIRQRLWPTDTFVDFEHSINTAVKKLREALGDNAEDPRFIETLPRYGYRLIASVKVIETNGTRPEPEAPPASPPHRQRTGLWLGLASLVVAGIALTCMFAFDWGNVRSRLAPVAGARAIGSIAVLPLRNLSNDPQQEYFSDGMTDELITALSKLKSLKVISHTSVDRYKQGNRTLPDIARELGVDAVVEGTVTRSGDRVRITAQLVDARSDQHLWAESYQRDLKDVFSLQDEVAGQIAAQVGIRAAGQQTTVASTRQVDPEAHEAYLKGNFYWSRSNCDGSQKGLSYYQRAVVKDPAFAAAYVGLAQAYFTLGDWNCSPYEEAFSKSKRAALKALELDPTMGPAHAMLATLAYFYEWGWDNADREYRQAIQLDPNYAPAHILYAVFLVSMARQEEGLAEMRKALELDPTAEFTNMVSVHILYLARQYDKAIEQAQNSLLLYPDSWGTYFWLGVAYQRKGIYEQALDAYLRSKSLGGATPTELAALRNAYQKSGIQGYWRKLGDIESHDKSETCSMRLIYARLGDTERIMTYLNWAYENHCESIRTLKVDSFYDNLRGDPRFQDVLTRLQLQ